MDETTAGATGQGAVAGDGPRVLIAEDGPPFRRALERMLASQGYTVESVADGEAALERLRQAALPRVDVVLADVRMPGMSGTELAEQAARQLEQPLAYVFMSGSIVPVELPADAELLVKPFEPDALFDALDRALG
jgi:CheY-like chemotaxis protein